MKKYFIKDMSDETVWCRDGNLGFWSKISLDNRWEGCLFKVLPTFLGMIICGVYSVKLVRADNG